MIAEKMYSSALPFLEKVVTCKVFADQPLVLLQLGECLFNVNRLEEAGAVYKRIVKLLPSHQKARQQLSTILNMLGRPEDDTLLTLQQSEQEIEQFKNDDIEELIKSMRK